MAERNGLARHTNGGSTLIELLVAVVVIAIRTALLLPTLNRVQKAIWAAWDISL